MKWLEKITPRHIQTLVPYASARREASQGKIWLNANENPFKQQIGNNLAAYNRYPEAQPGQLLLAYSDYSGVSVNQLLVTRGIDEGIDLLIRAFCEQGQDQIIYTPPTYGMYRISAETNNIGAVAVPLRADWSLDVPGIHQQLSRSKLIFLCSPNNPTGSLLDPHDVRNILEVTHGKTLVILDEAYVEFKPESSLIALLAEFPHLVVMRTLSKAFGLAGLRCGFILTSPEIIAILKKVSAPYPIPVPVVNIASQALSESGIVSMKRDVESLQNNRARLMEMLQTFSFVKRTYTSSANFVLFKVADAASLMGFLLDRGVVIRNQSSQPELDDTLRITVGTATEIQSFIQCMQDYEASL